MKKGIVLFWILIFSVIVAVTAFAVKVIVTDESKFHGEITVKTDGVTHEVFEVKTLTLFPSDEKTFSISVQSDIAGKFSVSLSFEEAYDGGMKKFVLVTIASDGKQVYDGTLSELLNGKIVKFDENLSKAQKVIEIKYTMPIGVGDEAQNSSAKFIIHFEAVK